MHTWNVTEENGRFRWTVYRNGKQVMTGTRKRKAEAEKEATGSIRHAEKIQAKDRAAA
jgi:hypothetical protein